MPTQRDVQRLIALREAKKRGVLGATQSAAVGELENRFSQYFKEVGDRAKSVAEPAMTAASATFAEPVSGLVGLAALPFGADVSTRAIEKTQDAMTYQPRTEAGKQGLQGLMSVMGPVGEAFEGASSYLGDAAYEATGSPAAGAAAYSVPALGMEMLGLKGTRAASKAGKLGKQFEMGDIGSQRFGQRGAASMPKGKGSAKEIMDAWKERGIKSFISERPDKLVLDKIIVPDAARGQGIGTQAMQELIDYADETGKRIELSPSADFGGSKKRLTEFYRRQGFIENKGKNKDFEISESMYRPPAKGKGVAESAGVKPFGQSTGDKSIDSRIKSVEMMTPDEYLQKAYEATDARIGGSFEGWMASNQRNADDVAKYVDAMKSGDEFPMPYIDFDAGSQDGRNRALAAKAAGIEQIPVGIVPRKTSAQRIPEIVEELKDAKGYRKFKLEAELESLKNEPSSNP